MQKKKEKRKKSGRGQIRLNELFIILIYFHPAKHQQHFVFSHYSQMSDYDGEHFPFNISDDENAVTLIIN